MQKYFNRKFYDPTTIIRNYDMDQDANIKEKLGVMNF